jgi:hypothetical protein
LEPEGRERDIMRPPFGPYLIDHLFGLPFLSVRWYGAIIISGATLAALVAGRRARERGQDREHVWGLLMWGLVLGIACARAYYVAFEWQRYAGRPLLEILNPQGAVSPSTARSSAPRWPRCSTPVATTCRSCPGSTSVCQRC